MGYTENAHSLSGRDYKGWVGAGARGIPPPSSYGPSAGSGTLHFFNRSVVFLKALHRTMPVSCCRNTLDGVVCTGERRDVRNLVLDGGLTDGAFVLDGVALCPRRVDDQVHLLVQDDIENVRAAFGDLVHDFALDAGLLVELGGAFGGVDLEAELLEFLADFDGLFRQVNLVGEANQHGTFVREEGTCSFLALVVSEGVVIGEAEHFAGGAHFGAENRVNLGELVEREHGFLGAVVVELLVLELQVRELFAEHQAGREAGLWRPFGLQPHSRLRRLVKTSRLRLTGVLQTLETKGTMRENSSLGVPAHICAVGLYFRGDHLRFARYSPPKTKPYSREHQERTARKSSPQGVTIPNAKNISFGQKKTCRHQIFCYLQNHVIFLLLRIVLFSYIQKYVWYSLIFHQNLFYY